MRKSVILSMAVMLTAMVGCQKYDEVFDVQENKVEQTYIATIENGADSRTALDESNNVLWSENDQISVFGGTTANTSFILKEGANTTYGEFGINSAVAITETGSTTELSANAAYYPYDSNVTVSENAGSFTFDATFPAEQTFSASGTFGLGASPMVAVTAGKLDANLKFKNVGAIFRLQLQGEATITKVVFSAEADIAGDVEITASNTSLPTVNVVNGTNTIVLDCGEGVELSTSEATNFIVAMLPTENLGDLTITIYDNAGKKMSSTWNSHSTIERSKAYSTEEIIYSGEENANTVASVQEQLDNATGDTTIQLDPGVDYGTLVFRQAGKGSIVDITDIGGDAAGNEKFRKFENITILGAPGATVDQIDFQVGWLGNSEGASYIEVKDLTVDGVTFSGEKTAFNLDGSKGSWLGIDGLNIVNCKMNDANGSNRFVFQQITGYNQRNDKSNSSYVMTSGVKNLTINSCEITGAYQVIESRAMENLTITNNTFESIAARDMLITADATHYPGVYYTGTITITGNKSNGSTERFLRADGLGDVNLIVKNNTITNYKGADYDYIKVTGWTTAPTIENNSCEYTVDSAVNLQKALDCIIGKTTINLTPGVNYGVVYMGRPTKTNTTTMYCATHDFTTTDASAFKAHLADGQWHTTPQYTTTIKDLTINGATGATIEGLTATSGHCYGDVYDYVLDKDYASGSAYYLTLNLNNIVFSDVNFTGKVDINTAQATSVYDGIVFDGCSFTTGGTASANGQAIRYYNEINNGNVKNLEVKDCKFNNCYQGVYVQQVNGVTVTGSKFDTTGHNAIALQSISEPVNLKNVVITGNNFNNIQDRIIRFGEVGADSNITIKDNVATNSGDTDGEVIKATSIASGVVTSISGNDWDGGIVVNNELKDE